MKIKYIAWKKVINSDVNRLIYATKGKGLRNTGDQAIQNFNTTNENPGLWFGFTNGKKIPRKKEIERENKKNNTKKPTTFDIPLSNSVNPLRLWEDKNESRKNPIKINHEIWDRKSNHEKAIIEPWYLGYMRLLRKLLNNLIDRDGEDSYDAKELLMYVDNRLKLEYEIKNNILKWIYDTQDGFAELDIDTSFMESKNLKGINEFISNNFYIVAKCEENGIEKNMALMASIDSKKLHPKIKELLLSNEKGGEEVDIDVAVVASSPKIQEILDQLYKYKNIILYGPPGTGKTQMLTEVMNRFEKGVLFDYLDTEAPFSIAGNRMEKSVKWCTFHPNYAYENFVKGIIPQIINNELYFKPHIGPLLSQSILANRGIESLLIIDEINRAKSEDVFGDTIEVLDNKSNEFIKFTHGFNYNGTYIDGIESSNNLFVIGTMNSLDKSTSPLSPELKRRFVTFEVLPDVEVLKSALKSNKTMDEEIIEFCCKLMLIINKKIHDYCGKEFEIGQGYFWNLVYAKDNHYVIMVDIIKNKIMPHLKDILPSGCLYDFFTSENLGVLYTENDYGYDYLDMTAMDSYEVIEAFSRIVGISLNIDYVNNNKEDVSFEEYEKNKINSIKEKLVAYKNVIIRGSSGTGKSYIVNKIKNDNYFIDFEKMFWHSSTEYSDVIEGISTQVINGKVEYNILPGRIQQLSQRNAKGPKLMIIEGINKSNAAENFGELITLLEPDKRHLDIDGMNGKIKIPNDMYFLCTLNPTINNQYKLDSAMKRRFIIIDLYPDYKLLSLHLRCSNINYDFNNMDYISMNSDEVKCLAIKILKKINKVISCCIGLDYQIGHSVLWDLHNNCSLLDLISILDLNIVPQIAEYCYDEDIAILMFGEKSPVISLKSYGIELKKFKDLEIDELSLAIKELLKDE